MFEWLGKRRCVKWTTKRMNGIIHIILAIAFVLAIGVHFIPEGLALFKKTISSLQPINSHRLYPPRGFQ